MSSAKRIATHHISIAMLIFIAAAMLRISYINSAIIENPIRADAAKYLSIAVNLLKYDTYSHILSEAPSPDSFITPGYPLFLTGILSITQDIEASYHTALFIQAILSAITAVLIFLLGLLFIPKWGAVAAGILTAFSPHMTTMSGYLLTETLFTFFLVSSLYLLALALKSNNKSLLFIAGIFIGLDALVRPAILLFPVVVALIIWINNSLSNKQKIIHIIVLIGAVALTWSPWAIWKHDKTASSNNAAASFSLGSYPNLIYKSPQLRGYPYREDKQFSEMSKNLGTALEIVSTRFSAEPTTYFYWYMFGKPTMLWQWDTLIGQGGPFVYPVAKSIYSEKLGLGTLSLYKSLHPLVVIFAAAGTLFILSNLKDKTTRHTHREISLIIGILAYFTLLHMVFAPLPRYSIPAHPFLYLAAAYSSAKLLTLITNIKSAKHNHDD